jgi:hypothetical protein
MKILLDECLPLDFRHSFPIMRRTLMQWAGLKGSKNGELMRAGEASGYDLVALVNSILRALERIQPGQTMTVPLSD